MGSAPTRRIPVGSGPLDPAEAAAALEAAEDRGQIFGLILRAARCRASYAALLSVHTSGLRGQQAIADERFESDSITAVRLPRHAVPALEEAIGSGFPYVGPIATGDPAIDAQLESLGGRVPAAVMILPFLVKNRTMAVLVGHAGDGPLSKEEVADLYPILTAGGQAMERFLDSRAGAAAPRPGRRASTASIEGASDELTALRQLLEVYRQYESWEELTDAIRALIRSGVETGDPEEDEQLELLLELGRVEEEQLDRPELAIEALRSALTIDAGDRRVLDALERLFVAGELWQDLVHLLERRAALADDLPERTGLLLNAAAFAAERLGDGERAAEAYQRILGWEPDHRLASAKLEELYRERAQWRPLAALLVDRASHEEETRLHVAALEAAAEIYQEKLEDLGAAFLVWMAVLRREPDRAGLLEALERLGPAASAWDDLLPECEGLAEEVEAEHPQLAARIWHQIARWYRDHLGDPIAAAGALDRSLRADPDELDAARELAELRRSHGPAGELAAILARCAELEIDPEVRAELLVELAEVHEHQLAQVGEALACLDRAFGAVPGHRPTAHALRRLHQARSDWAALALLLRRHASALAGDAPRAELAELHRELGEVLATYLGRPDEAAEAFRAAIEHDPSNIDAYVGLKQLHRAIGDREAYLEVEQAELAATRSPAPARQAALAEEWEARERFDRAAAAWERLLAIEPRSEEGHAGLARSLRHLARWDALASACRAHLEVLPRGPGRIAVLLDLASALEAGVGDLEGAIEACQEVLELEDDHRAALDALARLHERTRRWNDALGALERLGAAAAVTDRERADLQQRMGRVHATRGDTAAALACFEQARALDPRNAGAHEGLGRVHREREDWPLATHHLERAAQLSGSPADGIRCLMEAADIHRARLGDVERARDCLERALELDGTHPVARGALRDLLSGAGAWEALWPHLAELAERAAQGEDTAPDQPRDIYLRAARCAIEIGNPPRALELIALALALDPADVESLLARADALFRAGSWEEAARAYNSILVQHAGSIDRGQTAAVYRRLALIQRKLGRDSQASAFYRRVLEVEPRDRETLEELIELDCGRGHFDEAIASLRALAEAVGPEERAAVVERIGDLYVDKLSSTTRASSTYLHALELDPRNRKILQKLLDVQSEAGQWKHALDTIARFIELEQEGPRRGKYFLAAAAIRRAKLHDLDGALEDYERALAAFFHAGAELDPGSRTRALEAFEGVDEIITEKKDWKRQERAYRTMIERMPKGDPVVIALWQALGEIYRSRLSDYSSAIVAFETAHALDPAKPPERVKILGELYSLVGKRSGEDMVERATRLVEADPSNPDGYRALGRACMDAGRLDEAWCVCRALVFLKQASPAEEELYRKHQDLERRKSRGILDDDAWRHVRDPDEDRVVSAIFSLVWQAPVALRAGPPKSFELKEREKLKVEDDSRVMSKIFQRAARVLNAPLPHVYVQPERSGRLLLANCVESRRLVPTLIVGRDLMTGFRDTEVAFSVASTMALLRPAYYLRLALPSLGELEAALAAAATVAGKQMSVRSELAQLASQFAAEIQRRLTPEVAEALAGLVARLDQPDLVRWRNAVGVAARRAGLLVCGELAAAASMVSSEPAQAGGPQPAEEVRRLVAYSVSSGYFAARRHLGVSIAG